MYRVNVLFKHKEQGEDIYAKPPGEAMKPFATPSIPTHFHPIVAHQCCCCGANFTKVGFFYLRRRNGGAGETSSS